VTLIKQKTIYPLLSAFRPPALKIWEHHNVTLFHGRCKNLFFTSAGIFLVKTQPVTKRGKWVSLPIVPTPLG